MSTMNIDTLKASVQLEIDRLGDIAIRVAKDILQNPEPGFRENATAKIQV